MKHFIILTVFAFSCIFGSPIRDEPCNAGKETWGYIEVKPGANMFYWLICANVNASRPLVVWLQGGPGASSTGMGNFMEVGPLDINQKKRNNSWIEDVNVLFVDNPVGTGFSYVNDSKLIPKNNTQVAKDLIVLLKGFFTKVAGFENTPIYILGESYGGKMAAGLAVAMVKEIEKKKMKCNVAGVILADSWIKPIDSVMSWGPYLYTLSMLDTQALGRINALANATKQAVDNNQMRNATELFLKTEDLIMNETNNVNFYNILKGNTDEDYTASYQFGKSHLKKSQKDESRAAKATKSTTSKLFELMNGPVKTKLNIPKNVTWGGQSTVVFDSLAEDFMSPAVKEVELLLNTTKIPVTVYNGQLDLICSTPSVEKWASEMNWAGTKSWINAKRIPGQINNSTIWFEKNFKNFNFFWILRAGHMVPIDQLAVSRRLIQKLTGVKPDKKQF